jgi:hypothetical protein
MPQGPPSAFWAAVLFGPAGAALAGALGAGLGVDSVPWDENLTGFAGAGVTDRLVVLTTDSGPNHQAGQIANTVAGPGRAFSYKVNNPRIHRAPGASWDGTPDLGNKEAVVKWADNGQFHYSGGYPSDRFRFALLNDLGQEIGGEPSGSDYRPGGSLDPRQDDGSSSGGIGGLSPEELRDLIRDLLNDLMGGDEEGEGEEEEEEEEENGDDDEGCEGKHKLAIMKATLDKLYFLVGGELFGGDKCKPGDRDFSVSPESLIRDWAEKAYEFEVTEGRASITARVDKVTNLVELFAALVSVGYVRSGQWRYPSAVDDSIVKSDAGFLGDLFGKPQRLLADQQDYQQWFLEQFDAVLGPWQQKIEIVDTDLEQPGNQSKTVRLPNLSEAISEIFLLAFDAKTTNDTALNFLSRLALEQVAIKKELFVTQKLAEVIIDYLGPKTKEVKAELPLLFTLLAKDGEQPSEANLKARNNLATLLEASTKEIVISELAQSSNLQSELAVFKQASAIVRASLAQSFGSKSMAAIREAIVASIKLAAQIDAGGNEEEEQPGSETDFSKFLTDVELGFIGTSGITDTVNPYGRPPDQRPKIREIGRDEDDS